LNIFWFFLTQGETLVDTKNRLQLRLGMNDKDFSKVRIAIVPGTPYPEPEYLENDSKLNKDTLIQSFMIILTCNFM
jgi:hypothetical protein